MIEQIDNIDQVIKTPDSLSDKLSDQDFNEIRSHIDVLHQVTSRLEKERYRNRIVISVLGIAIVVVQLLDAILKMLKP